MAKLHETGATISRGHHTSSPDDLRVDSAETRSALYPSCKSMVPPVPSRVPGLSGIDLAEKKLLDSMPPEQRREYAAQKAKYDAELREYGGLTSKERNSLVGITAVSLQQRHSAPTEPPLVAEVRKQAHALYENTKKEVLEGLPTKEREQFLKDEQAFRHGRHAPKISDLAHTMEQTSHRAGERVHTELMKKVEAKIIEKIESTNAQFTSSRAARLERSGLEGSVPPVFSATLAQAEPPHRASAQRELAATSMLSPGTKGELFSSKTDVSIEGAARKELNALKNALDSGDLERIKKSYSELREKLLSLARARSLTKEDADMLLDLAFGESAKGLNANLKSLLENPQQFSKEDTAAILKDAKERCDLFKQCGFTSFGLHVDALRTPGPSLPGSNVCGPNALFHLIRLANAHNSVVNQEGYVVQSSELLEMLHQETDPGALGTDPAKLKPAVEKLTGGKYTLEEHKFQSGQEALDHVIKNVPCLIKFGSSLTAQHYATVVKVIEVPGHGRIFITADGLAIREKALEEMMEQKPYPNRVWGLTKKQEQVR